MRRSFLQVKTGGVSTSTSYYKLQCCKMYRSFFDECPLRPLKIPEMFLVKKRVMSSSFRLQTPHVRCEYCKERDVQSTERKEKAVSVKTASWHRSHTNGKQRLQFCQVPLNSSTLVSQAHIIGNE